MSKSFSHKSVDSLTESQRHLYNQAVELKNIYLKCDANISGCICHVVVDVDMITVIACAFYRVHTIVFIEILCVRTQRQHHGQFLMNKIISLNPKKQIHLIALRIVIQFYLSLNFKEQPFTRFCEPTCALCFNGTCHMMRPAGPLVKQLTRSMAANKCCNPDPEPLDPNLTLIVTGKEQVPQEYFVFASASASASDDVAFDDCASVTSISAIVQSTCLMLLYSD